MEYCKNHVLQKSTQLRVRVVLAPFGLHVGRPGATLSNCLLCAGLSKKPLKFQLRHKLVTYVKRHQETNKQTKRCLTLLLLSVYDIPQKCRHELYQTLFELQKRTVRDDSGVLRCPPQACPIIIASRCSVFILGNRKLAHPRSLKMEQTRAGKLSRLVCWHMF